jgi:hypothetical protein
MRVIQWKRIGDRRVRLVVWADGMYAVVLDVLGAHGFWEDISLRADQHLLAHEADARYQQRLQEQHVSQTCAYPALT